MSLHAFVDESFRGFYLVAAVIVPSNSVGEARRATRRMLKGSQGRVHMAKENEHNKKALIGTVVELGFAAQIVTVQSRGTSQRKARNECLTALVSQLVAAGVSRITIESCDQDREDRQVVGDALARLGALDTIVVHLRPHDEPLLWLADIVAWAHGRGGAWKARLASIISHEIVL